MSERILSRWFFVVVVLAVAVPFAARPGGQARASADRCLVPVPIREPILNEVSGEQAQLHVQFLAANRDRQAAEYQDQYFETTYIRDMAKQYGLSDVQVDFFPTRDTWDAEEGDLWIVQPRKEKIASITMVPTALAQGSKSTDVEAEVVYVGLGREADYAGKDVKGKIVLGSGSVVAGLRRRDPARGRRRAGHGQPGHQRRRGRRHAWTRSAGRASRRERTATDSAGRCRCGSSSTCGTCSSAARRS